MNKSMILLATVAGIALSAPAFAADATYESKTKIEKDDDGDYKKTTHEEISDDAGTTTADTKVKTDVDSKGNTDTTVTTKTVDDPDGLMNKTKTTTEDKVTHKDGKVKRSHKKKVNGKTVEDHKEESAY